MPRRDTPFVADHFYHFYNRGNNRQIVFFERDNYLYFLRGIKKYLREYVEIIVYCLMPTHYHILARVRQTSESQTSEVLKSSETSTSEISRAMQKFGISYTKAINKRFSRVGSLFQGQFQGKRVKDYEHLLNIYVYIHANPVKDGLVALPDDWEYSNYLEWMNLREGTLVNHKFIKDNFGTPEDYKQRVMTYIKTRNLPEDVLKYLQALEK